MLSESELTKEFTDRINTQSFSEIIPIVGGVYGKNGSPDRLLINKYWCGLIEFKKLHAGKMSPLQKYTIEQLNRVSIGSAFCVFLGECGSASCLWFNPHCGKTWEFFDFNWKTIPINLFYTLLSTVCEINDLVGSERFEYSYNTVIEQYRKTFKDCSEYNCQLTARQLRIKSAIELVNAKYGSVDELTLSTLVK